MELNTSFSQVTIGIIFICVSLIIGFFSYINGNITQIQQTFLPAVLIIGGFYLTSFFGLLLYKEKKHHTFALLTIAESILGLILTLGILWDVFPVFSDYTFFLYALILIITVGFANSALLLRKGADTKLVYPLLILGVILASLPIGIYFIFCLLLCKPVG